MRRRRSLGDKCQLEVVDDAIHHGVGCEERNDLHRGAALRTGHGVDFKNLADHLCLSPARDSRALLHDDERRLVGLSLAHLPPVGVGIEAEISHSDGFGLKKPSGDPRGYAPLVAGRSPRRRGSERSEHWKGEGRLSPPVHQGRGVPGAKATKFNSSGFQSR